MITEPRWCHGLQLDVLGWIFSFDDFLVVEGKPDLGTVRILAKNVNGFLLGKIAESSSKGDRVQHRRRVRDPVGTWAPYLSQDVELLAVDLLNDNSNFRFADKNLQPSRNLLFQLKRVCPAAWTSPASGSEIFPSDRTGTERETSGSFQTLIASTSSLPIMNVLSCAFPSPV